MPKWIIYISLALGYKAISASKRHPFWGERTDMKKLVRDGIEQLVPYPPGKPIEELERELGITGSIKLASNENPLGPSPKAMEAIKEKLSTLNRVKNSTSL